MIDSKKEDTETVSNEVIAAVPTCRRIRQSSISECRCEMVDLYAEASRGHLLARIWVSQGIFWRNGIVIMWLFIRPAETNPLWNQQTSEGVCNSYNIPVNKAKQHD